MHVSELIKKIQEELNEIKKADMFCHYELDDYMFDKLNNIQQIINDFNNQDFKKSEPDPFA